MNHKKNNKVELLNAFCIDLEEWFHVGGLNNPWEDESLWDAAKPFVEHDTGVILDMLKEFGHKATFLTVGWIAEKYPQLIERIDDEGHEVGCHGYYHRMVWTQTPDEFRTEVQRSIKLLKSIIGKDITTFRAPCFSMKKECFWAYPILAEEGIKIDVSLVPAARHEGGVIGFERDPIRLQMPAGDVIVFPVTVMKLLGKATQFSGGGHLRALPISLIHSGFKQNHKVGRPVQAYIHPREVNPDHPRVKNLPRGKYFRHYVGMKGVQNKLRSMMKRYPFGTITEVIDTYSDFPVRQLKEGEIMPV